VHLRLHARQLSTRSAGIRKVSFVNCGFNCRFYIGSWNMSGYLNEGKPVRTLREIVNQMRTAYCSTIGFEVRF
jgi:2-oxoglutarate dehydrogenase complex dehydrogenase (E1) component-like enzyme